MLFTNTISRLFLFSKVILGDSFFFRKKIAAGLQEKIGDYHLNRVSSMHERERQTENCNDRGKKTVKRDQHYFDVNFI